MATAYTAKVRSGEITSLEEFAVTCSRVFGIYASFRDEPLDAKMPKRIEENTIHHDLIRNNQNQIAEWRSKSAEDIVDQTKALRMADLRNEHKRIQDNIQSRKNYEAMLTQVLAWTPPNEKFVKFKEFMQKQIEDSLAFDCDEQCNEQTLKMIEMGIEEGTEGISVTNPEEIRNKKIASLEDSIEFATKRIEEERKALKEKNDWLELFYNSFDKK